MAFPCLSQPYVLDTAKSSWSLPVIKLTQDPKADYSIDQQKKMYANMAKLIELIHKTPFLNPPKGYTISNFASICAIYCNQRQAIKGTTGMIIRAYYTDMKTGKKDREGEGPSINFTINNINRLFGNTPPDEDSYYEEPALTRTFNGFPVYDDVFLVITKNSKPLFSYVTNEQVINIQIRQEKTSLERVKQTFSKGTPYQQYLAQKDDIMKGAMEGFEIRAKYEPDKAKVVKEKYLEGMRKMDSSMKADEAKNLKDQQQMVQNIEARIQKLQDKLQSMSPVERSAPVLSPSGRKYVVANKEFYSPALPASTIQVLIIDLFHYNQRHNLLSNLQNEAIQKFIDTVDFKSLLAVIE
jgi:predicted DNA binding CopG/RHH family protein